MADVANNLIKNFPNRSVYRFDFGATNRAAGAHTVFTVSGLVLLESICGYCTEDLVGAGTIELGVAGDTAGLIAQIADATTLDAGEIWIDATPDATAEAPVQNLLVDANIILTVGVATITDGILDLIVRWWPMSVSSQLYGTTP